MQQTGQRQSGKGRSYSPKYKAEVVAWFLATGKTVAEVVQELNLRESTVRGWIARAAADAASGANGAGAGGQATGDPEAAVVEASAEPSHSEEFKAEVVAWFLATGKTLAQVADELYLTESTVRDWIRQAADAAAAAAAGPGADTAPDPEAKGGRTNSRRSSNRHQVEMVASSDGSADDLPLDAAGELVVANAEQNSADAELAEASATPDEAAARELGATMTGTPGAEMIESPIPEVKDAATTTEVLPTTSDWLRRRAEIRVSRIAAAAPHLDEEPLRVAMTAEAQGIEATITGDAEDLDRDAAWDAVLRRAFGPHQSRLAEVVTNGNGETPRPTPDDATVTGHDVETAARETDRRPGEPSRWQAPSLPSLVEPQGTGMVETPAPDIEDDGTPADLLPKTSRWLRRRAGVRAATEATTPQADEETDPAPAAAETGEVQAAAHPVALESLQTTAATDDVEAAASDPEQAPSGPTAWQARLLSNLGHAQPLVAIKASGPAPARPAVPTTSSQASAWQAGFLRILAQPRPAVTQTVVTPEPDQVTPEPDQAQDAAPTPAASPPKTSRWLRRRAGVRAATEATTEAATPQADEETATPQADEEAGPAPATAATDDVEAAASDPEQAPSGPTAWQDDDHGAASTEDGTEDGSDSQSPPPGVHWVETTGWTLVEAREAALELLGVDDADAFVEVIESETSRRLRRRIRVRAHILATAEAAAGEPDQANLPPRPDIEPSAAERDSEPREASVREAPVRISPALPETLVRWIEASGRTEAEAREAALDQLGVDDADADVEVLHSEKTGRLQRRVHVRARILLADEFGG